MGPVRVKIFKGEKTYKIPFQESRILPASEESNISRDVSITLKNDHYIEFIARTKERIPPIAEQFCKDEINKAITILSLMYTVDIFDKIVFSNWLLEERAIISLWIKPAERQLIDKRSVVNQLTTISEIQQDDEETKERFLLMSNFYAKSLLYEPSEEKFLLLWTILEIFPMKDTTNIKPISVYLSNITGESKEKVKEKLGIGKMYDIRSNLVHNGQFKVSFEEKGEFLSKVEEVVQSVLREMIGLPYEGKLDKYLA